MALKSSSRNGTKVIWIVAHTAEGATTKESLFRYFSRADVQASSHVGIDADGIADWVDRDRAAWTLRNGNPRSVNAELCFFAKATRAQWLSTTPVFGCANPRQMIRNLAWWIVREATHLGIPLRKLTVDQVRGRVAAGYIDHDDYTDATGDGTHWDVGDNFPWDVLAADIGEITAPTPPARTEDDMGITYLVRTDESTLPHQGPEDRKERRGVTYCVSSNGVDCAARWVGGGELAALTAAGVKPVVLTAAHFTNLLNRALDPAEKE